MPIGERIRAIREAKKLSQGDVEKRSGLSHVYISRIENDHIAPSVETLEKIARALEVPLYQLGYEGEESPRDVSGEAARSRKNDRYWVKLRHLLATDERTAPAGIAPACGRRWREGDEHLVVEYTREEIARRPALGSCQSLIVDCFHHDCARGIDLSCGPSDLPDLVK